MKGIYYFLTRVNRFGTLTEQVMDIVATTNSCPTAMCRFTRLLNSLK